MKTLTANPVEKTVLYLLAALVLLTAPASAQKNYKSADSKYSIENVNAGIKSENSGVKKNMIYLAGKYKMESAVDALTEQLKNETDAETKVLIALSLYEIGSKEGMKAVKNLAATDNNPRVKRMSTKIYLQYAAENNLYTAAL